MKDSEQINKAMKDLGLALGNVCDVLRENKPGAAADAIEMLDANRCSVELLRTQIAEKLTGNADVGGMELLEQLGAGIGHGLIFGGDDKLSLHAVRMSDAIADFFQVYRETQAQRETHDRVLNNAESLRRSIG